jgi:ubiquinone/menaquinone biosynthesis C-methylase UbiE
MVEFMAAEKKRECVSSGRSSLSSLPLSVLEILRCPLCLTGNIVGGADDYRCTFCGSGFQPEGGILDLRGEPSIRMPRIYKDRHYQKWTQSLSDSQDYYYESNPVVSYVQNAGHRAVQRMRRGRKQGITLDLGCGDGAHCRYLNPCDDYLGIDMDQRSLEKLKMRFPEFPALKGDGYNLPIKDETIDCIISIYNLEHMVHLDLVLEEMTRVLKPRGDAFVSVPNEGGMAWRTGRRLTSARAFTSEDLDYIRANEIDHINCVWQIRKALKRYFRIRRQRYFPFRIPSFHLNAVTTFHCVGR